jgi:hypothetical protein
MAFIVPNQAQIASKRPIGVASPWVRPADWITITDTPNEVQFLVSSLSGGNYRIQTNFSRPAGQNLYIDWGDGVINTISSTSTSTNHNYTTGGTPSTQGYDTWKVRVYVDSGASITGCYFTAPNTSDGRLVYQSIPYGVLEAYYGDGISITNWNNYFLGNGTGGLGSSGGNYYYLQYVKLPSVISGASVSFDNTFNRCFNLAKVVMPISCSGLTSMLSTFQNCQSLQGSIDIPQNATAITNFQLTFNACVSISGATLPPSLPSCTSVANIFNGCYSLGSFQMPSLPVCTDYNGMFANCHSLLSMQITGFTTTAAAINMPAMFQRCYSIEQIILPATLAAGSEAFNANLNNTFSECSNLKSIVFPSNINSTTLNSCFYQNYSICNITLPTSMSLLTDLAFAFFTCVNLQSITLPTTIGASVAMNSAFNACYTLTAITIPSTYNITTLSATFTNCWNLINLTLPNNAQNSLTTMATMCQNCFTLKTITMPTSLNACVSLANAFQATYNLTSVVFPTSMNACTTLGSCFSTSGVQSITFPTSMSVCTTFTAVFQFAQRITDVVLPATIPASAVVSFASCFVFNPQLRSVVFPTTQSTGLNNLSSCFSNSPALTTITNADKLGNPSTTGTTYIDATGFIGVGSLFSGTADFSCKFSKLVINSVATGNKAGLSSLRLRNTGSGQYGGTSPQIDISYTNMGQAALVQLFNDLPTITAKTINITGATGAAALTPAERAIATGKGWTITG